MDLYQVIYRILNDDMEARRSCERLYSLVLRDWLKGMELTGKSADELAVMIGGADELLLEQGLERAPSPYEVSMEMGRIQARNPQLKANAKVVQMSKPKEKSAYKVPARHKKWISGKDRAYKDD